jgi:hypothetical protein
MSSSSAFNPSRIRKDPSPKVERRGRATFSFPNVYKGPSEFFEERPIEPESDDDRSKSEWDSFLKENK